MGASRVAVDVPAELLTLAVGAFTAMETELEMIAECDVPLSDDLHERLREHAAMKVALQKTPEAWKPQLRELYTAALKDTFPASYDSPRVPILPEVQNAVQDVRETLRRAALTDPAVDAALRQVEGW